jgi:hypothetical protein
LLAGSAGILGGLGLGASLSARAAAAATPVVPASGLPMPGGLTCPVPFVSRAAWGADESIRFVDGDWEYWPATYFPVVSMTVHHAGYESGLNSAATIRDIYRAHTLPPDRGGWRGWGDIGYNLLIDADGVVFEGRHSVTRFPVFDATGRVVTGAHVALHNPGNIGICLLGNLQNHSPSKAAQDSLVKVLAYLATIGDIDPLGSLEYYNPVQNPDCSYSRSSVKVISGHRDWASTDCPGDAMYALLGGVRQRVAAAKPTLPEPLPLIVDDPTTPGPLCTPHPPSSWPPKAIGPHKTATPTSPASSQGIGGDEILPTSASPTAQALPALVPTWDAETPPAPATGNPGLPGWEVAAGIGTLAAAGGLGALGWFLRRRRTAQAPAVVPEQRSAAVPADAATEPIRSPTMDVAE